jgi:chaperone modulatory protein CbpM
MTPKDLEWQWLDAGGPLSLLELSTVSAISATEIEELIGYGALHPLNTDQAIQLFSGQCVAPLRTAGKLRRDYDLDLFTVVIMMDFLIRIETLESQLTSLKARHQS